MDFKVIVTVGDALLASPAKLKEIDSLADCIYRINGAHISIESLPVILEALRQTLNKPSVMLDLPGNKIRTSSLSDPISLAAGETFELHDYQVNYPKFRRHLKIGDIILSNDSNIRLEVVQINGRSIKILSHSDGFLENNKGLHVKGMHRDIPFLFHKDEQLLEAACLGDVEYISLSFVRNVEDIRAVKKILNEKAGKNMRIIAKIETIEAMKNLDAILDEVDTINIDRGDLSTEVGMLDLAHVQEAVIKRSVSRQKSVFLATQFLKNMERHPVPLIAEVMDLYKTMRSGISGIQLSEETAVGKYPVECVKLLIDMYKKFFIRAEDTVNV